MLRQQGRTDHLDTFEATFNPDRTDDLREGTAGWAGRTLRWQAAWIIEDGPYEGQWACCPDPGWLLNRDHDDWPPFAWVPEIDLDRSLGHHV